MLPKLPNTLKIQPFSLSQQSSSCPSQPSFTPLPPHLTSFLPYSFFQSFPDHDSCCQFIWQQVVMGSLAMGAAQGREGEADVRLVSAQLNMGGSNPWVVI